MIKRTSTFFLGLFIAALPFLGLPSSWKTALIALSGLTLVALSVKIELPTRKAVKRVVRRKEKVTPVFTESEPISPYDDTPGNTSVNDRRPNL